MAVVFRSRAARMLGLRIPANSALHPRGKGPGNVPAGSIDFSMMLALPRELLVLGADGASYIHYDY